MAISYQDFKNKTLGNGYDIDGWFLYQCLTEGHLVKLSDNSYKDVSELVKGDVLSTGNTVLSNETKEADVYYLSTSQGWAKVTKDHKVFTTKGEKVVTELVKEKDSILIDTSVNTEAEYDLTEDELRFFGFWLGDGTTRYRWENTTKPQAFLTVGTEAKRDYIEGLNIHVRKTTHSNGKASIYTLTNRYHKRLNELIHRFNDKNIVDIFTPEQYSYIIEGYSKADGSLKGGSCKITSVNKQLLVTIQHGCHVNGWSAVLSKKWDREPTNFCDNPKPIWRLSINKNRKLINRFISLEPIGKETVYVLNTDGDHSYFADNQLHHNCWDGYAQFCIENGIPYANCTVSGFVKDLWEQRHSNGILNYFDEVTMLEPGDLVIFKEHPWTPYSHVAVFDSDIDGVYGTFLGQNQGPNSSLDRGGEFSLTRLPYEATYDTAFRLKQGITAQATQAKQTSSGGGRGFVNGAPGLKKDEYFLDVSAYQSADLTAMTQQAGTNKTIIKVSEHTTYLSDVRQAQADTSVPIGYYHFARFGGDVGQALAEANFFLSNLPSKPVNYLVCDYEDNASGDMEANTQAILAFMDACAGKGYQPIYYSYKPYTLANVNYKAILAKYPNSLWIAAYPNYEVTPTPVWEVYPTMEGIRWWQFTSTGIAGGLDKNIAILSDDIANNQFEEEEDEMTNYVIRSNSGKQGYLAITNGIVWGIGDIKTVGELQNAKHVHLNLPDGDFDRFINAQKSDDVTQEAIAKAIEDANKSLTEVIAGEPKE